MSVNEIDVITSRYVIAAGASQHVAGNGNYFVVTEADGIIKARINGDGGAISLPEGTGFELPIGRKFSTVELVNDTGSAITLDVAIGYGRFIDNRSTVGGTVAVSITGQPIDVDVTGQPIEAKGYGVEIGASNGALSSTGTLVSAVTNTAGVRITSACLHGNNSTGAHDISGLVVDGVRVLTLLGAAPAVNLPFPLFVPAGIAITYANANGVSLDVSYEVLP